MLKFFHPLSFWLFVINYYNLLVIMTVKKMQINNVIKNFTNFLP